MTLAAPKFLPQSRPKGWPVCAARTWGGAVFVFIGLAVEWIAIYGNIWVGGVARPDFFFNHVFYIAPISIIVFYSICLPLNSGSIFGIKLFYIAYRIIFSLFYVAIPIVIILALFVPKFGLGGLTSLIPSIIIIFVIPFILKSKRKCSWLNLNSQPDDWEPPSLAKDRARMKMR